MVGEEKTNGAASTIAASAGTFIFCPLIGRSLYAALGGDLWSLAVGISATLLLWTLSAVGIVIGICLLYREQGGTKK